MKGPELVQELRVRLALLADPARGEQQTRYLKYQQDCLGIAMPVIRKNVGQLSKLYQPETPMEFRQAIDPLWGGRWREERYAAQLLADRWKTWRWKDSLAVYEHMVRTGQWWDLVDFIATSLVGRLLLEHPDMRKRVYRWIGDSNMWIRRTALLCQIKHKDQTDTGALEDMILKTAHEKEFFIRKAIGWALRSHAYTDPEYVRALVKRHQDALSPLSRREALKNI